MNDIEYSQLQARARQIRDESCMFIEKCRMNIQTARNLRDEAARVQEEAMILKEECIADKSKSIAILLLTRQHKKLNGDGFSQVSSIGDDTSILLQMIEEVRRDSIAEQSPLDKLRTELLALSFLPDIS